MMTGKKADLAGPGIGNYEDLEKILPTDYHSLLSPRDTQKAVFAAKTFIEANLCKELNLMMVQVPLIVDVESGVNDMLDRDGSRTPIQFHISNDYNRHPIDAQVVQAATKWKRVALKQFGMRQGEGICTDMRAVRKDYFLDHDHSAYVDQWDWEKVITADERNLEYLKATVRKIWKVLKGAETDKTKTESQVKLDKNKQENNAGKNQTNIKNAKVSAADAASKDAAKVKLENNAAAGNRKDKWAKKGATSTKTDANIKLDKSTAGANTTKNETWVKGGKTAAGTKAAQSEANQKANQTAPK
jgi:hypothetical protein